MVDTSLNISTFVIIGLLVWLYCRSEDHDERDC